MHCGIFATSLLAYQKRHWSWILIQHLLSDIGVKYTDVIERCSWGMSFMFDETRMLCMLFWKWKLYLDMSWSWWLWFSNGLLPDTTRPSPETAQIYCQKDMKIFQWNFNPNGIIFNQGHVSKYVYRILTIFLMLQMCRGIYVVPIKNMVGGY